MFGAPCVSACVMDDLQCPIFGSDMMTRGEREHNRGWLVLLIESLETRHSGTGFSLKFPVPCLSISNIIHFS